MKPRGPFSLIRAWVVLSALVALLAVWSAPQAGATTAPTPGSQLWARSALNSTGYTIAVSSDGSKVFVTGGATVAYNAATGKQIWKTAFAGRSISVSPDSSHVFVLGNYKVVSFNAATGAKVWTQPLPFQGDGYHDWGEAYLMTLSRDGSRLYVAGDYQAFDAMPGPGVAVVAYDAASGKSLWGWIDGWTTTEPPYQYADYEAPGAIVVGPNGSRVFVTGEGNDFATDSDSYLTVALDATTGNALWASKVVLGEGSNFATSIALSPNASRVFVTGESQGSSDPNSAYDLATVALAARTGSKLWSARSGPIDAASSPSPSVGISPDGSRLFVGATTKGSTANSWTILTYSTGSGAPLWVSRYDGPTHAGASASGLGVSPDGSRVFVTGTTVGSNGKSVYATGALAAGSGARLWISRYAGLGLGARASDIAVGSVGTKLFVTGSVVVGSHLDSQGNTIIDWGIGTVAYAA